MRCIYIVPNGPISPNFSGGGSAIYYEQLCSLSELGVEIYLWHFTYESRRKEFELFVSKDSETWGRVSNICKRVVLSNIADGASFLDRFSNKIASGVTGIEIQNPLIRRKFFPIFRNLVKDVKPHFVWAQHLASAQIALLQRNTPVVYSHHDWIYKVKYIDSDIPAHTRSRRIEENATRAASGVVSGSMVECGQIRQIGCKNVHYIPLAYAPVKKVAKMNGSPRVVHLGGLGTTANRIGLERFFDVAFDKLGLPKERIWMIGDLSKASEKLKGHLQNVTTTGHVQDLDYVLRPYDIHIIPWEHDTGQRTRMVCAFNYGQAVVAVRKAVSCYPEARHGENCILVDSLDEMPAVIGQLMGNTELRKKIGENARRTFMTHFTREALLPSYRRVVETVTGQG